MNNIQVGEVITSTKAYIVFPDDNDFLFFMDHWFWRNVPSEIKFYPESENSHSINFIADGYGVIRDNEFGLAGSYGNGSIHIYKKQLPDHIIKFCQLNFLNKLANKDH